MKAFDLVNSGLLSLHPDESILDAIDLFVSHNLDIIPVKRDRVFIGIVRKIDIVLTLESFSSKVLHSTKVKDCMISKLDYCKENESLEELASNVLKNQIGTLLVKQGISVVGTKVILNFC